MTIIILLLIAISAIIGFIYIKKSALRVILGIIVAISLLLGGFIYIIHYRINPVDTSTSPDGTYELSFQQVGDPDFPFGYTHASNVTCLIKISCENLHAEADMGSIEIKGVACEAVEVAVDMGSADISGDFAKISAKSSMGGITINTTRPEEDIEFNLDVDMGEAIINGRQV